MLKTDLEKRFYNKINNDFINYQTNELSVKTKTELFNNSKKYYFANQLDYAINCIVDVDGRFEDYLPKEQMLFVINYKNNFINKFVEYCMFESEDTLEGGRCPNNYRHIQDIMVALCDTLTKLMKGVK